MQRLFRLSAEQDNPSAMNNLGICYENGEGVPYKDLVETVKWYTLSAERGNIDGQLNLGLFIIIIIYFYQNIIFK